MKHIRGCCNLHWLMMVADGGWEGADGELGDNFITQCQENAHPAGLTGQYFQLLAGK